MVLLLFPIYRYLTNEIPFIPPGMQTGPDSVGCAERTAPLIGKGLPSSMVVRANFVLLKDRSTKGKLGLYHSCSANLKQISYFKI
jgi:hypothetical protein